MPVNTPSAVTEPREIRFARIIERDYIFASRIIGAAWCDNCASEWARSGKPDHEPGCFVGEAQEAIRQYEAERAGKGEEG